MNEFDKDIEEVLNQMISLLLIPHFEQLGMNATGEWEENIKAQSNSVWGRDYTKYLVEGRPSGSYAPIAPLVRWAKAKFGMDDNEARKMAFAVSNKLKNEGSEYWKQGGTDLLEFLETNEVKTFIIERLRDKITPKIAENLTKEINLIFRR